MTESDSEIHVVVDDGVPVYVTNSLEKCREVVDNLEGEFNSDVQIWEDVSYNLQIEVGRDEHSQNMVIDQ